jgi:hypothetical protein
MRWRELSTHNLILWNLEFHFSDASQSHNDENAAFLLACLFRAVQ